MSVIGRIHSFESCGTVDGPGIRFITFFQGCLMRCLYCHNRDTWDTHGGKEVTVEDLMKEVVTYRHFMNASGGGVTTSSGAERCSLGRETADSRNQKERCVTYELHPICWTVWYTVQQMGCVYMPKGIPQNQIKTKRPEPCAVQDSDRSGRLILVFV